MFELFLIFTGTIAIQLAFIVGFVLLIAFIIKKVLEVYRQPILPHERDPLKDWVHEETKKEETVTVYNDKKIGEEKERKES